MYFEILLSVISKANPVGLFLSLIKVCFYPLHMTSSSHVLPSMVSSLEGTAFHLGSQELVSVKPERLNLGTGDVLSAPLS